jgi:hypothetical protein
MRKNERSGVGGGFRPKIKTQQKLPTAFFDLIRLAVLACCNGISTTLKRHCKRPACRARSGPIWQPRFAPPYTYYMPKRDTRPARPDPGSKKAEKNPGRVCEPPHLSIIPCPTPIKHPMPCQPRRCEAIASLPVGGESNT